MLSKLVANSFIIPDSIIMLLEENKEVNKEDKNESDEEDFVESDRNVVVQVEDEDTSRGGNSLKSNYRGDKFIPQKSDNVMTPNELNETKPEKTTYKEENGTETDSGKDTVKNSESEDIEQVDIKGEEQTEKTETVNVNGSNERKLSSHIEDNYEGNQDTYNEIEEEIFSEYTDRTKAEEIVEEEINEEVSNNNLSREDTDRTKEEVVEEEIVKEVLNKNLGGEGSKPGELKTEEIENYLTEKKHQDIGEGNGLQQVSKEDTEEKINEAVKTQSETDIESITEDKNPKQESNEMKGDYTERLLLPHHLLKIFCSFIYCHIRVL